MSGARARFLSEQERGTFGNDPHYEGVQDVKACEGTAGGSADNAAGSPQGVASVLEASRVLRLHKKIHSLSMKGDFFSCREQRRRNSPVVRKQSEPSTSPKH